MARRKINVVSNELDQAPKNRAAGYGKVVNSMRKEISEAMDRIFLNGSDVIADYMNHTDRIPIKQLLELQPGDHLSFEVKREKIEYNWFTQAVWHPAFLWDFNNFTHNCYWFEEDWAIKPGEKSLIIVVEKDVKDPKSWKIHAEQLEYPGKWAMLMQWMFFHNPDVSDENFKEIVWTEYKKEEMRDQIKENLEEEIKIEEDEAKNHKKSDKEDKKEKSLGDKIKWWFK